MNWLSAIKGLFTRKVRKAIPMAKHIIGTDSREYDIEYNTAQGFIYRCVQDGKLYVMDGRNHFVRYLP
jgi:hypothetical protein